MRAPPSNRDSICRALLTLLVSGALLGCAGTRSTPPRDGADDNGLSFKETGWLPTWPDATEGMAPGVDGGKDQAIAKLDHPTKPDLQDPDLPPPKPDLPCPGGCDDGSPCTEDSCNGVSCIHTPIGQIVMRYYNANTGAHAYVPVGYGAPGGFALESPVFRTLKAATGGSQLIYQQTNGTDYMISLSSTEGAACCGYQNYGNIGHGFAAQQAGTVPLYRFWHQSGLHLSSLSSTEGTVAGYSLEGVTVYVCP